MTDYLIRTQASHEWPAVHRERLTDVLVPTGYDCQVVDGWGDLHLRCGEAEVSFSGEEPGWLVTVEGDLPDADGFLARVTTQVTEAAGEPCEWLNIG
ncbi:hypothetical protein [Yimella sp. cx-51]|uniref:hypothetical protein n=1 Tax=Yimella sp. cx-51 TaxID=2770551 RepID=UPI00165EBB70|nr:hypothetical protein [Yimella sp. cx-51]MBC9956183.1 hypothetical protein [Yimella sp. cx-51]QTH38665.1 hypothetical protein J5M86_03160 [Yimella sp. cx-51]